MRRQDATADAVARLLPRLGPIAVLLTDDPDGAVRLLGAALSSPGALDRPEDAVRALVRAAVHPPRWAAVQVIEVRPGSLPADGDAALAGVWRTLAVGDRAAVVAQELTGLPRVQAETAVSRLREEVARRDEDERRQAGREAALYRRPGTTPEPEPPMPDLPRRLARLAAARPLPETAPTTIGQAIASVRHARGRRRLGLVAGVLAATAVLALPAVLPQAPGPSETVSVYAGPTRGSLAGDGGFLGAMSDSRWAASTGTTGPRRVVFAGDVAGGRWVLLAGGGTPERPATTAWFGGPAGAFPDRMMLVSVRVAPDPAQPVAVTEPATGALVVVGAPGDRIRVSTRPYVDVGGSVSRSFWDVPTPHGVATVALAPVPDAVMSPVRLDLVRRGARLDIRPPTVVVDPGAAPVDTPISRVRPPAPPAAGDAAVAPRLRALLGQLGEPVGDTAVTAVWSGDLPGPNDQPVRLTVLAVPQPSGAVVVTAPYGYAADASGRTGSSWCGTGVLPAGLPLDQRVIAVRCDLSDLAADREISRYLIVIGPRTAPSVRLVDPQGTVLRVLPLTEGVATLRSPGDVERVSSTAADGRISETVPLVDTDLTGA